jgi:cytochrome b561
MQLRNSTNRYGAVSMILHWSVVGLVIIAWALGTIAEDVPRGPVHRANELIHVSIGLLVLVLSLGRLLWRFEDPPPALEQNPLGPWLEEAGRFTHHLLNVLLMAIPVLGMIGLFADGKALPILALTEIASPWGKDHALAEALVEVHGVFANALMIVAALHAAAAIFHHSVLRDRTLVRMLPHRLDSCASQSVHRQRWGNDKSAWRRDHEREHSNSTGGDGHLAAEGSQSVNPRLGAASIRLSPSHSRDRTTHREQ